MSPKNSYLSIPASSRTINNNRPMTARSIFSLSVFTFLISSRLFYVHTEVVTKRRKCIPKYIDTDNRRHSQQKTFCVFLMFMLISVIYIGDPTGENGVTVVHTRHDEGIDERLEMESVSRDRLTRRTSKLVQSIKTG